MENILLILLFIINNLIWMAYKKDEKFVVKKVEKIKNLLKKREKNRVDISRDFASYKEVSPQQSKEILKKMIWKQ
ncbi:MAG: hypothetical protein QXX45_03260 [Candidatus Aenigmatarchaeota archaeon]